MLEVLQTLLVLGEDKQQEPVVFKEDSDDEATIGEWELVKDGSVEGAFLASCPRFTLDSTLCERRLIISPRTVECPETY